MKNKLATGTLYLMVAQLTIVLSGYFIHIAMARYLGPSIYGDFGIILSLILVNKTIFLTGINRAVSKFVSAEPSKSKSIVKSGLIMQLILVFISLAVFWFGANYIAAFFKDPGLVTPIRYSSLIILPLGLYIMYAKGFLNGVRRFKEQANFEAMHSLAKVVLALLLIWLGFSLLGAITAYILAPLLIFFWVYFVSKKDLKGKGVFSYKKIWDFALPITIQYAFIALITELSIFAVKYFLTQDALVGYYTSASSLAKILPSLFRALPFAFLPSISMALAKNDFKLVRKYIQQGLRYSLLILVPAAVLLGVTGSQLIEFMFSANFLPAAPLIFPLTLAFLGQAIFLLLCSILNGSGLPKTSMIVSGVTLLVAFLSNIILVPRFGLVGAAYALLLASFFGVALAAIVVYAKYKQLISFISAIRITTVAIIIYVLLRNLYLHFTLLIGIGGVLFFVLLYLIGEINSKDIGLVKSIIGKK